MGIREVIIEHFGEDDFVVKQMNKRGLDYGVMLAKTFIHKDNLSPTAKEIRSWQPPDVLDRTWEAPARTQPRLKKLVFRERPIARYTADEYCRPTARPSLWQIFRAALVRVR